MVREVTAYVDSSGRIHEDREKAARADLEKQLIELLGSGYDERHTIFRFVQRVALNQDEILGLIEEYNNALH